MLPHGRFIVVIIKIYRRVDWRADIDTVLAKRIYKQIQFGIVNSNFKEANGRVLIAWMQNAVTLGCPFVGIDVDVLFLD